MLITFATDYEKFCKDVQYLYFTQTTHARENTPPLGCASG